MSEMWICRDSNNGGFYHATGKNRIPMHLQESADVILRIAEDPTGVTVEVVKSRDGETGTLIASKEAERALAHMDWLHDSGAEECPECHGNGTVSYFNGEGTEHDTCSKCCGLCYLPNRDEFPEFHEEEAQ